MHLAAVISTIILAWRWGDWKNWQRYHTTMLYVVIANLLYNFIYGNRLLWRLNPDFLYSHTVSEIIYSFIVFPLSCLLLLSNYPTDLKNQVLKVAKFIVVYILIEWVFKVYGRIEYFNGWKLGYSLLWNLMMFPMWILHHKKPLAAYAVSIILVITMIIIFPVSFK